MDEIWVPTEWNKEIFVSYLKSVGFTDPLVHVIPEAVDVELFSRAHLKFIKFPWVGNNHCTSGTEVGNLLDGRRVFEFLSIFKWERRKGWDILLDAYWGAFSHADEVILRLHTYVPSWVRGETNVSRIIQDYAWQKYGKDLSELAPVAWENELLSRAGVRELYGSADAFVLPTRGEGWGLPIAEAMSMELPVIVSNFSGPQVFANSDNAYVIPMTGAYDSLGFATPSSVALKDIFLQVIRDSCPAAQGVAKNKAKLARESVSRWSPVAVVAQMKQRLQVLARERGYSV